MKIKNKKGGFTLIELLVVIAIIAMAKLAGLRLASSVGQGQGSTKATGIGRSCMSNNKQAVVKGYLHWLMYAGDNDQLFGW